MSDVIIRVDGLGKKYRIRRQQSERYTALRDVIAGKFRGIFRRQARVPGESLGTEDFWALKEVSFEVKRGEVLGIIGRNGAGKSTLLKILSRITDPTEGRVELGGRVASLLEVGTGFHPELTGRENIYLNGAILGMTRMEAGRKFDEIVAFAEVEKFLDTPVKRYSSGMYVRLAFAVAAHLEPEILIVDEVLAVGDMVFQKKCLEKMDKTGKEGRTVIFVTHNLDAAAKLCDTGILLKQGMLARAGAIDAVLDAYKSDSMNSSGSILAEANRRGSGGARIERVWIRNARSEDTRKIEKMGAVSIVVAANIDREFRNGKDLAVGIGIDTDGGSRLVTCVSSWQDGKITTSGETLVIQCDIPFLPLLPGTYRVSAALLYQTDMLDLVEHCTSFEVTDGSNSYHANRTVEQGYVDLPFRFEVADR